jgi:hypothetical protein
MKETHKVVVVYPNGPPRDTGIITDSFRKAERIADRLNSEGMNGIHFRHEVRMITNRGIEQ